MGRGGARARASRAWWVLVGAGLAIGVESCGCESDGGLGPRCDDATACAAGYVCEANGRCARSCADGGRACPAGSTCAADGTCAPADGGGASDGAAGDVGLDGDLCASVSLGARAATPTVYLVVDQSGSMNQDFGASDRWNALRDSLLADPDGLVFDLQAIVRFGLALYSARAGSDNVVDGECPVLTRVVPALDNYTAIEAVYGPADPIDETPTGDAIHALLDEITGAPDPTEDPVIFIVATDGEPDTCAEPNPQNGQALAVESVERAFAGGIRTYMISVGEGTVSATHMRDMANAGLGRGAGGPDAPYWVAGDDAGLRAALREIVGGALSCLVTLDGSIVVADACDGTVTLNGRALPCDDPDGWHAVDETHIELLGDACDELLDGDGATLEAAFPCDVILI